MAHRIAELPLRLRTCLMNDEDTNEAQTFSESTALETENLPLEVPAYIETEPGETAVQHSVEGDSIDELLSALPKKETGDDPETIAALRAENESLKNTIQILSERYDIKCQEFDKLMKSRPRMAGLPQPAPEYRERIKSDYWN